MKILDFDSELKVRQHDQTDGQCVSRRCFSFYAFTHGEVMKVRKGRSSLSFSMQTKKRNVGDEHFYTT